jgi:transposase
MISYCEDCFEKQRKIDELTEEVKSLKAKMRHLERNNNGEGYFGSSTPSSKIPVKTNSVEDSRNKRGGARLGHVGHGRHAIDEDQADRVIDVKSEAGNNCPLCGESLEDKGSDSRLVIDMPPLKAEKIIYRLPKKYCRHCHKIFRTPAPNVLPKNLYGNQIISQAAVMHYLHGIPMGRICEQTGIEHGSLIKIFHSLAKIASGIQNGLIEEYRQSPAKHADETSWRNDGTGGYAWLFATGNISIFLFRKSRSASVVHEVLGADPLPGTLVVDRYNAYNKSPCAIQYCYAHLLREVEDLGREFVNDQEVREFVGVMASLLSTAMSLRSLPIPDNKFYKQAKEIKDKIIEAVHSPAKHCGIRRIQDIFHEKEARMYRWSSDRRIPAENNLAERDLRPTVIARKVSFGSQSDAGAYTRSILMTLIHTIKKTKSDPCLAIKTALDKISRNPTLDKYKLFFSSDTS